MSSPDSAEDDGVTPADATDGRDRFFGWFHHAVAVAYAISATVSTWSGSLRESALLFLGSLLLAYVVVAVLTVVVRRFVPGWFP